MRGRKPQPTAQQIAEGDPRKYGVRKLQEKLESEPKAQRGLGECPRYLRGGIARDAWNRIRTELEIMGLDCAADTFTLEVLCIAYQALRRAYREGDLKNIAKFTTLYKSLQSEFGLSPVSRTRLTVDRKDTEEDQDIEALLSGPRVPRVVE